MAIQSVGLQTTIWNNKVKSVFLLVFFPLILLVMSWGGFLAISLLEVSDQSQIHLSQVMGDATRTTLTLSPIILGILTIWYLISFAAHRRIIDQLTGAEPLERNQNPELYNLLENLCISRGMDVPKLCIIPSESLNAFASGLTKSTYTITVTQGLVDKLTKSEMEAVLAHELTHIRNQDVRLLVIAVVFVGIISVLSEMAIRAVFRRSSSSDKRGNMIAIAIVIAIAIFGYIISILIRFALSRRREYLADAGAVELIQTPDPLIKALQKVEGHSEITGIDPDVKQLFFDNQSYFLGLFSTHPSIEDRIRELNRF
jgi:heat shock protein HtpX